MILGLLGGATHEIESRGCKTIHMTMERLRIRMITRMLVPPEALMPDDDTRRVMPRRMEITRACTMTEEEETMVPGFEMTIEITGGVATTPETMIDVNRGHGHRGQEDTMRALGLEALAVTLVDQPIQSYSRAYRSVSLQMK
jgi:hypothetical protein